ncbi:DNA (cytosine-5-)-methyltransferase [Candidatus Micrarchaeota archaeon]|nr:DNA (cytosine-5-)-methyltransferase [Candidatus Micrarchaeota archaeon]
MKFDFIDLFAGIGGFRIAFEGVGGECVFSSEWNRFSQETYEANFGETPTGDITSVTSPEIPDHDILMGGFPCQPFSIAGVSKKISLGRKHGFEDKEQGNLFFEIARILRDKRPKAFLLENVKNLATHDKGRTFEVILDTLIGLDYSVFYKIIDAQDYVPQHRERIFIVGFDKRRYPGISFEFPNPPASKPAIKSILEKNPEAKYTLTDKLWKYLQAYAEKHRSNGNGFGFGIIDPEKNTTTRTLSARYHKDGSEILIKQTGKNPRRLTPRECCRLMGFPEGFIIPVSDTQAYRQFGNAVAVPVVRAIARQMVAVLSQAEEQPLEAAAIIATG